jgi:uncharacterized protein
VRDTLLLRAVKRVTLWNFVLNVGAHRLWLGWRGEHVYKLGGDCRRCARCCEAPALRVGRLVFRLATARALFLWWQQHVNGWSLTGEDRSARVLVFRCSHFDPVLRSCDSYASRPGPCRDYPRLLLEQTRPEFLPGCGYRPISPRALPLRRALEDQGVSGETLARLARELYLE